MFQFPRSVIGYLYLLSYLCSTSKFDAVTELSFVHKRYSVSKMIRMSTCDNLAIFHGPSKQLYTLTEINTSSKSVPSNIDSASSKIGTEK